MTIAKELVRRALRLNNEFSNILAVDPDLEQEAFISLVNMLEVYRGDNMYLTYQIPASISEDIQEFPWATKGLEYDLAYNLAPYIQNDSFSGMFFANRKDALATIHIKAEPVVNMQYPETLPVGGGNEQYNSWTYRFYGEKDQTNYDIRAVRNLGEKEFYVADFEGDAVRKNTTVSSVEWVSNDSGVTITLESLSGNVARALVEFTRAGGVTFKAIATYANGGIHEFLFNVQVNTQPGNQAVLT